MNASRRPKHHHYVPQLLLQRFADDRGMIWAFDKSTERVFQANPRNVAGARDFYRVPGPHPTVIEDALSNLEGKVAPVLSRIVSESSLSDASRDDRELLALFAAIQMQRTVHPREVADQLTERMRAKLESLGHGSESVNDYLSASADETQALAISILIDAFRLAEHFISKDLLLLEWRGASALYLGDNPIAKRNHRSFGPYGNLGIAQPGIEINLPISRSHTLSWMCPSFCGQMTTALLSGEEAVRRNPSLHKQFAQVSGRPRSLLLAVETGAPFLIDESNVRNLNALQVEYAERFVFSPADDFEPVRQMLRDSPGFRSGPRITIR